MVKRSEHEDENSDEETSSSAKKQRIDDMALVTLPGSLELTASGEVRDRKVKNILQSPTVLLTGHTEAVYSIAFDPTGSHLASASLDRSISKSNVVTCFSPCTAIHSLLPRILLIWYNYCIDCIFYALTITILVYLTDDVIHVLYFSVVGCSRRI